MTPLAARLAKQLVAHPKRREHIWREPKNLAMLRDCLSEIHCFEVTQVAPLLVEMKRSMEKDLDKADIVFETFSFLPAPKTWVEWRHPSGNRVGILLEKKEVGRAYATFFCDMLAVDLGYISTVSGDYFSRGGPMWFPDWAMIISDRDRTPQGYLAAAHSFLILINSPKIIGRQQHMPNASLERRLTKGFGIGKFPLHAWSEIKLQVSKPIEIDDGESHEVHLTGKRALHFVRKHVRIRLGRLEYVSAHWRGDPAIGIKQSRYVVTP
jgi:hypothetical protein